MKALSLKRYGGLDQVAFADIGADEVIDGCELDFSRSPNVSKP